MIAEENFENLTDGKFTESVKLPEAQIFENCIEPP